MMNVQSLRRGVCTAAQAGVQARVTAVMGGQWGDEGKGKLADVLAKNYDVVARFNGGANAGHTVVVEDKKYAFHLLPCGLIYPHTQNILGNGTVVHLPGLFEELEPLDADGLEWRGRLKISDRAHMLFDFHQLIDGANETALGGDKIGTTKKGIGPAYTSKMQRNAVRFGELKNFEVWEKNFRKLVDDNTRLYPEALADYDVESEVHRYRAYAGEINDWIVDGVHFVNDAYRQGKNIITEGANAAMLDIDFGTYPFVTSSTTTAGGLCTGLGLSPDKVECVMGVVKAYTTRVGSGPFPTELTDDLSGGDVPRGAPGTEIGKHLQDVGFEYGVTTGRKRRCGWLDIPVLQYAGLLNGYSSINLTKLDVLNDLDEIKIGVAYQLRGEVLAPGCMPSTLHDLEQVEVVYESMPGWNCDITNCATFGELPTQAQAYVQRIEALLDTPVSWIGTGPGRTEMAINYE